MQADPDDPRQFRHRTAVLNGNRWHFVDAGAGPVLLLLHGFPYTWYAFRKLIPLLAGAGYRVIAPDLLGYGETDAPHDDEAYTQVRCTGDLVALLDALEVRAATLVGHDVGASYAFAAAQMRADRFGALVLLGTPQTLRAAQPPGAIWRDFHARTGNTFYQAYFATPAAVAELDADVRRSLRAIMFSVSGAADGAQRWRPHLAPGEGFLDTVHDPRRLPDWLSPRALDTYVVAYAARGFRGPLAAYRCREANWRLGAFVADRKPPQPCLFVGGSVDPSIERMRASYDALEQVLPDLRGKPLVPGAGHGLPEENPGALAALMLPFLAAARGHPGAARGAPGPPS
ncbi:MAG: alpha/beta hydrolase [Burkholderiales bacterium]|nr:alpha/beta hydrolase [Burkholderiales bacterium]